MKIKSCYKCKDRCEGCHGSCEKYITEKKAYDESMDVIRKEKRAWKDYNEFKMLNVEKTTGKRRGQR